MFSEFGKQFLNSLVDFIIGYVGLGYICALC